MPGNNVSFKTIRQKLASYLLRMLKQQGDSPIQLDRSQQELADYFGVSRPSLATDRCSISGPSVRVIQAGIKDSDG